MKDRSEETSVHSAAVGGPLAFLPRLLWVLAPKAVGRLKSTIGILLQDGHYLLAWPLLASLLPLLAIPAGMAFSWYLGHSGILYTGSLVTMSAMVVVGTLSSAVGAWLMLGFVVADYLFFSPFFNFAAGAPSGEQLLYGGAPLVICHVILFLLTCRTTMVSLALSKLSLLRLPERIRSQPVFKSSLQVMTHAGFVQIWTMAAPSLVRPVYTWRGRTPSTAEIAPLQVTGWVLTLVAAVAMALRASLKAQSGYELKGADNFAPRPPQSLGQNVEPAKSVALTKAGLAAAGGTFMLSGLLATWFDALGLLAFFIIVNLSRALLSRRIPWWSHFVGRIPILIRVVAACVASYLLSHQLIGWTWSMTSTFRPVLLSIALSYLLYYLLLFDQLSAHSIREAKKHRGGT